MNNQFAEMQKKVIEAIGWIGNPRHVLSIIGVVVLLATAVTLVSARELRTVLLSPLPTSTPWYDDCPPDPLTRTPWPTEVPPEPQPTYTPRPTFTPKPFPTCRATATLAPNPSPTPYPSSSPYPTATYYPTQTPWPTQLPSVLTYATTSREIGH